MGKVRENLADVKEFEAIPKDWYTAHIAAQEYKASKASVARDPSKPEMMFELTWQVDEGPHSGAKVPFDTISLSAKAASFRNEFLDAIAMERTCLGCGNNFTEGKKVTKEESKVNQAGLACPNCLSQADAEWDSGEPDGAALIGRRCLIGVTQEMSKPAAGSGKTPRLVNKVEGYARIK